MPSRSRAAAATATATAAVVRPGRFKPNIPGVQTGLGPCEEPNAADQVCQHWRGREGPGNSDPVAGLAVLCAHQPLVAAGEGSVDSNRSQWPASS